jgi:hypothetical protein
MKKSKRNQLPTYKVKVGKDELDVPLDELLKGYSRTADYTRKTQEIAESRKMVEADRLRSKRLQGSEIPTHRGYR